MKFIMPNKILKWLPLAALAAILIHCSGCVVAVVAAAGGAGAYAYVQGELKATEGRPLSNVHQAAQASVKDMQYPVISDTPNAMQAEIKAREADGTEVVIHLKKLSEESTEIRIRAGVFGDEELSRILLVKIHEHLR